MLLDNSVRDGQKVVVDYDRAGDKLIFQAQTVAEAGAASPTRS